MAAKKFSYCPITLIRRRLTSQRAKTLHPLLSTLTTNATSVFTSWVPLTYLCRSLSSRHLCSNSCAHNELRRSGMDSTTVYVLLVILIATLIRSAFGFGEALVAVPLLAIRIPISTAAPLAVLVSITVAAVIIAQDWRSVHVRSAGWLVVSTLFGIPIGLVLLTQANQQMVKGALAVIIVAFSAYALIGQRPPELHSDHRIWLLVCGFFAGVLGGAYGMNGPPLAIYGAMRRWTAQHFRATLQGYFLPASVIGMIGYWLAGLWSREVTRYYLLSLVVVIPAIFLGRAINRRLHHHAFLRFVHAGLIAIGATLLVQAVRG